MDDHVARFGLRLVDDVLYLLDDAVALLQVPVARQGQVKIDVQAGAGAPGAQAVHVDPGDLAAVLEGVDDVRQHRRVGLVHQPRDGLAQQAHPHDQDGHRHAQGDHGVQNVPAGEPHQRHAGENAGAGIGIGEQVPAVRNEGEGLQASPHPLHVPAGERVGGAGGGDQGDALRQLPDLLGLEQAGNGVPEDDRRGRDDERALQSRREKLHPPVPVGVRRVRRARAEHDAEQGEAAGEDVDDGLQGVGQDGGRTGEPVGDELDQHQDHADTECQQSHVAAWRRFGHLERLHVTDPCVHPVDYGTTYMWIVSRGRKIRGLAAAAEKKASAPGIAS